jgi:hypothetical protein
MTLSSLFPESDPDSGEDIRPPDAPASSVKKGHRKIGVVADALPFKGHITAGAQHGAPVILPAAEPHGSPPRRAKKAEGDPA